MDEKDPLGILSNKKANNDPLGILSGGSEKKKSENQSDYSLLNQYSESKKPVSSYQDLDIQSQLKSDGSSSESTTLPVDGIKQSSYSVTPSNLKPVGESTSEVMSSIDKVALKAKELKNTISEKQIQINSQSKELTDVFNKQQKELLNYEKQLNDPNIPDSVKDLLNKEFTDLYKNAEQTATALDKNIKQSQGIDRAKLQLDKIEDIKLINDARKNGSPAKAVGNFMAHVYNAVPETISGLGSLLESGAQLSYATSPTGAITNEAFDKAIENAKTPQEKQKLELNKEAVNKKATSITDAVGGAIRDFGNTIKVDTDKKYDEEHYIASTIGDIVGSIAVSAIPGSIASKAGKAAQIVTGATTAAMQTADGVHNKAKELGLSDKDAATMTLAIAPVSGLLEVWGATNIIDNLASKKLINELISESAKKLAGKEVTKELAFEVVSDTFKEVGKKYGKNLLRSAGEEGVTEGLQGELEAGAENIYDISKDKKVYGTEFFSSKAQLDVAKQAAIGAAAGGVFGVLSGISDNKSLYETAKELKNNPDQLSKFRDRLGAELRVGNITQEQFDNIKTNINSMMVLDEKIPDNIVKTERRVAAINLLSEKARLEQEIEGKDKSLTIKKRERINEINSELENIAKGRKLTEIPKREFVSKEIKTSKIEEELTPKAKFEKVVDLFNEISQAEGATKKRNLVEQRRALLEANPSIKYIDDNIKSINLQLEEKGLITKKGLCP